MVQPLRWKISFLPNQVIVFFGYQQRYIYLLGNNFSTQSRALHRRFLKFNRSWVRSRRIDEKNKRKSFKFWPVSAKTICALELLSFYYSSNPRTESFRPSMNKLHISSSLIHSISLLMWSIIYRKSQNDGELVTWKYKSAAHRHHLMCF